MFLRVEQRREIFLSVVLISTPQGEFRFKLLACTYCVKTKNEYISKIQQNNMDVNFNVDVRSDF